MTQKLKYDLIYNLYMEKRDRLVIAILTGLLLISFFLDNLVRDFQATLNITSALYEFFFSLKFMGLILLGTLIYFYQTERKIVLPSILSIIIGVGSSIVLKLIISRPRYFIEKFYSFGIPNFSFPSSHSALAFSILPFIINKKYLNYTWVIYAILVMVSRILLKQHYLSDTLGGALLGYGVGMILLYLFNRKDLNIKRK